MQENCFRIQRDKIAGIAKGLLESAACDAVLAFADGGTGTNAVPRFFREAGETGFMRWDGKCTPNLAKYLIEAKGRIAAVAKPCDARAIVMYMAERQINRDNLYIIGVECPGMTADDGRPAPGCEECATRTPPLFDVLVSICGIAGDRPENKPDEPGNAPDNVSRGESGIMPGNESGQISGRPSGPSPEKKFDRFINEIKKCMLCYACRQACYGCYCKTCFAERDIPGWMPADADIGEKITFHLGRAMHLAGRCVECGACERVCPAGVKIRYLSKEIASACNELYGCRAGIDPDVTPALSSFSENDMDVGFLGVESNEACCGSKKQD